MASPSICHRCALRIQRASSSSISSRSFSSTSSTHRAVPSFSETSSPELNETLSTIRNKHLIPAYLRPRERRAIFATKNRQNLIDNPRNVALGDEEIPLQWMDRTRDIPSRDPLISKAINLMLASGTADWAHNLPALLQGLNEGVKKGVSSSMLEKIVRKAAEKGALGSILPCLQQSGKTGMSLRDDHVLRSVVWGLRVGASRNGWLMGDVAKAIKESNVVALLLESKEHGSGAVLAENDPRTRPEVLGAWLELVAVYAVKFQDGKDTENGIVRTYAERLISRLAEGGVETPQISVQGKGFQWPLLQAIPIWHGLYLADKVLGSNMPNPAVAREALASYETAIHYAVADLETQNPPEGSYAGQALAAWRSCIRD